MESIKMQALIIFACKFHTKRLEIIAYYSFLGDFAEIFCVRN